MAVRSKSFTIDGQEMQIKITDRIERVDGIPHDQHHRFVGMMLAKVLRRVADSVDQFGADWLQLGLAQAAIDMADKSERERHAGGSAWFGRPYPLDLHAVGEQLSSSIVDAMKEHFEGGE